MSAFPCRVLLCMLACLLGGCFQLDPFLYAPERLEQYVFEPRGDSPATTVLPEQIEPLTLRTEDGLTLGAVYVRTREQPPRGYIIFFHGSGPALPGQFEPIKRLCNLGYDVLGVDYRGWGISSNVTPTEEGIARDGRAARAWLVQRAGGEERIVYYGQSFGAAVATQLAVQHPPGVHILESAFTSIEGMKTDASGMDFPVSFVAKDTWDNMARIGQVRAPVLLLHGLEDDFVRPEFSQQLYARANEPKQLVLVEGAAHVELGRTMGEGYGSLINGFTERYLPAR